MTKLTAVHGFHIRLEDVQLAEHYETVDKICNTVTGTRILFKGGAVQECAHLPLSDLLDAMEVT